MRAARILFTKPQIVMRIKEGRRKFLNYDLKSVLAKSLHVGDRVQIMDYPDMKIFVDKIVKYKEKSQFVKPGETESSPVIRVWFND